MRRPYEKSREICSKEHLSAPLCVWGKRMAGHETMTKLFCPAFSFFSIETTIWLLIITLFRDHWPRKRNTECASKLFPPFIWYCWPGVWEIRPGGGGSTRPQTIWSFAKLDEWRRFGECKTRTAAVVYTTGIITRSAQFDAKKVSVSEAKGGATTPHTMMWSMITTPSSIPTFNWM